MTRHLNQQLFQSGMNQEVRQLCLHPKSSRTHQFYSRTSQLEDLTVALAPMQKYTITTTLPFFRPANPIIEQRNPNDKWRLLVDLLMINELKFDDYNNNKYPVSKLSDAVQPLSRTLITTNVVPKAEHILSEVLLVPGTGELADIHE